MRESFFPNPLWKLKYLRRKLCVLAKTNWMENFGNFRWKSHFSKVLFTAKSRPSIGIGFADDISGKFKTSRGKDSNQLISFAFASDWAWWNCRNGILPVAWLSWFKESKKKSENDFLSLFSFFSWFLINRNSDWKRSRRPERLISFIVDHLHDSSNCLFVREYRQSRSLAAGSDKSETREPHDSDTEENKIYRARE